MLIPGYPHRVRGRRQVGRAVAPRVGANVSDTAALHEKGTNGARFDFRNPSTGTDGKFQPNSMHEPDDGDFPLDGLVMVQAGGLLTPLPVIPLKLVEV